MYNAFSANPKVCKFNKLCIENIQKSVESRKFLFHKQLLFKLAVLCAVHQNTATLYSIVSGHQGVVHRELSEIQIVCS